MKKDKKKSKNLKSIAMNKGIDNSSKQGLVNVIRLIMLMSLKMKKNINLLFIYLMLFF